MGDVWLALPAATILAVYAVASFVVLAGSGGPIADWLAETGFYVCVTALGAALLILLATRAT